MKNLLDTIKLNIDKIRNKATRLELKYKSMDGLFESVIQSNQYQLLSEEFIN